MYLINLLTKKSAIIVEVDSKPKPQFQCIFRYNSVSHTRKTTLLIAGRNPFLIVTFHAITFRNFTVAFKIIKFFPI